MPKRPGTADEQLVGFYTRDYREADRLGRLNNRLEFLRTRALLRERLPSPPARILDVGGGTGVHAEWLATDGYDVDLIDLVPEHVNDAREVSAALARPFTARVGDARSLDAEDESVDACLLLGPLYHLPEQSDRASALAEAVRVTRSGGLVCAVAISRYAWPLYELRDGGALSREQAAAISKTLATGRHDPIGALPGAFSHRPGDLAGELRDAGAIEVEVLGIEGPGWVLFVPGLSGVQAERLLDVTARAATLLDGHADMVASSTHLMAVGRRP